MPRTAHVGPGEPRDAAVARSTVTSALH